MRREAATQARSSGPLPRADCSTSKEGSIEGGHPGCSSMFVIQELTWNLGAHCAHLNCAIQFRKVRIAF